MCDFFVFFVIMIAYKNLIPDELINFILGIFCCTKKSQKYPYVFGLKTIKVFRKSKKNFFSQKVPIYIFVWPRVTAKFFFLISIFVIYEYRVINIRKFWFYHICKIWLGCRRKKPLTSEKSGKKSDLEKYKKSLLYRK